MSLRFYLAFRLMIHRRRRSGRLVLSSSGVALGIIVLYITLGVMDGYRGQLRNVFSATFAPIQVISEDEKLNLPPSLDGRVEVKKRLYSEAMILPCRGSRGQFISLKAGEDYEGLILGEGIAGNLSVREGDCARLMFRGESSFTTIKTMNIREIRSFGVASLDERWGYIDMALIPPHSGQVTFEIIPSGNLNTSDVCATLEPVLPPHATLITLEEANEDLFATLAFQEWVMAIVLGLITGVAGVFFLARLLLDVEERRRTLGVFRALGFTNRDVLVTFFYYGTGVGLLGIAMGIAGGFILSFLINISPLLKFKGALLTVYGVDSIPVTIQPLHALGISLFALIIVLVSCVFPAIRCRNLSTLKAIRYE